MPNPVINRRTMGIPFRLSDLNSAWVTRVLAAGGVYPSQKTLIGNDLFYKRIVDGGFVSKIKVANLFPFELNVPTFSTPLIQLLGLSTWTDPSGGWNLSSFTINGLKNPLTNSFDTGILPSSFAGVSASHGCVYVSEGNKTTSQNEFGARGAIGGEAYRLYFQNNDNNTVMNAQGAFSSAVISSGILTGYVCESRTTSTRIDCFYANSATPHASAFNDTILNTAAGTALRNLFLFATNENGSLSNRSAKRISYASWGDGLTLAESAILFAAVQEVRQYWGGGFT